MLIAGEQVSIIIETEKNILRMLAFVNSVLLLWRKYFSYLHFTSQSASDGRSIDIIF